MALDTTVGGASAASYLSVAGADALAAVDLGPAAATWLAADAPRKEAALARATRELEAEISTTWRPWSLSQALIFPRSIDVLSSVPFIPLPLQRATYEQAKYVLHNEKVIDAADTRTARQMASASESNLSYSEGPGIGVLCERAQHYLSRYITVASAKGSRSVRMATGYVP